MDSLYAIFLKHPEVCTDTRKIIPGSIFFALKGNNFNGNEFASYAIEQGCSYAVIDEEKYKTDNRCILVDDVLKHLQLLAQHHRNQLNKIKIIGLTGSNGKTTTKELIFSVLSKKYNVLATEGNLNNHIGVPLTLLKLNQLHQFGIIEMGANHQKEIAFLSSIAQPNYGLITNIGKAHLEGFGGIEGVRKGKTELYDYLQKESKLVFVNADDQVLMQEISNRGLNAVTYGKKETCFACGDLVRKYNSLMSFYFKDSGHDIIYVDTNLSGEYNFYNAMAAVAIGRYFNVDREEIKSAIESYQPNNNRSQLLQSGKNLLIMDAYNANPTSMKHALDNLIKLKHDKKYFVLGDMLELGEETDDEHIQIIQYVRKNNLDGIFVGKNFYKNRDNTSDKFFIDTTDARKYLLEQNLIGFTVLIKGSRGIKLEALKDLF